MQSHIFTNERKNMVSEQIRRRRKNMISDLKNK